MPKKTVYFPEIFKMVGEVDSRKEKIAILHKFQHEKGFFDIIKLAYDPKCKWVITRKEIEYLDFIDIDIADYDLAPSTLFLEARRRLYNFTNARQPPLKKEKVMILISQMFSSLYHEEIELFKQMVDGRIEERGLTERLVREAFPGLLNEVSTVDEENLITPVASVTEGNVLSNINVNTSIEKPVGDPPAPKPKKEQKKHKSKLDTHKKDIHSLLKQKKTKSSIAKKYNISISGLNNWLKRNPEEGV